MTGSPRRASLLRMQRVRKALDGRMILDGVDVRVAAGEIVVLVGPNGAGKTTLMRIACGRTAPDSGEVGVCGGDPHGDPEIRRQLGLVPQGLALYPYLTVRENLETFGRMAGVARRDLPPRIDKALEWSGLVDRGASRVDTLSGGMRRRLNMVASLLHEPRLLLLDEPTAGVDINARKRIHDLLERLRAGGTGVLLTTHDLDQAASLADRVVFLIDGRVCLEGAPQALIRSSYGSGREVIVSLARRSDAAQSKVLAERGLTPLRGGLLWIGAVDGDFTDVAPWARELDAAGLCVTEIRVREPDLEGVFLQVTGEELHL